MVKPETVSPEAVPIILIVDDTPANLELLCVMLTQRGYEPRPVPSGKLALQAARADPPDLILLDIRMPEMDGFAVCQQLKADDKLKDIPVIFITALAEKSEKLEAFSHGAVDYVTKPFHVEEIEARVKTHLRIRALQRRLSDQNANLEHLVEERTAELAKANLRLQELGRLRDDFFQMISHEIRTPANGILGIGELILELCPPTEESALYIDHFKRNSSRLLNLIDDATTIATTELRNPKNEATVSLLALFRKVQEALEKIEISMDHQAFQEMVFLQGDPALVKKALETTVLLASCFLQDPSRVRLIGCVESKTLQLRIDLDQFLLSAEQAADFFRVESLVRCASAAEPLGLAPVAAQKILSHFGGGLRLVKGEGNTGILEMTLVIAASNFS